MTTLTLGLRPTELPAAAVATAFREDGVLFDDVIAEPIDGQNMAWRWRLRDGAPSSVDSESTSDDGTHPAITGGVVVETRIGWVVVTGTEDEGDLVLAASGWNPDIKMSEPLGPGPMPDNDPISLGLLGDALAALGAAWLRLGGKAGDPPTAAVEAALEASTGYREARREFSAIFRRVLDGEGGQELLLDLEQAVNELASEALDVGWNLGMHGGSR